MTLRARNASPWLLASFRDFEPPEHLRRGVWAGPLRALEPRTRERPAAGREKMRMCTKNTFILVHGNISIRRPRWLGRLSSCLLLVDRQDGLILAAGRMRSKKNKKHEKNTKKSTAPKTHHKINSSPAIATTSRRRVRNHAHALAHTRPLP